MENKTGAQIKSKHTVDTFRQSEAKSSSRPSQQHQQSDLQINEFVSLVNKGIEAWSRAGELLAKLYSKDNGVFMDIINKYPWITPEILSVFLRIGRKQIHPRVLLLRKCAAESELQRAPYHIQEKLCEEPIDVVISIKGREPIVEKLGVQELSVPMVRQVFNNGIPRTIPQQVAYKEAEARSNRVLQVRTAAQFANCSEAVNAFLNHKITTGRLLELYQPMDIIGCMANIIDELKRKT